jgi:microcystin-dependent protein
MAQLPPLISFTAGSPAVAGDVNQNFTDIRNHLNGANVDTENIAATLLSRSGGPILNLSQLTENQIAFNVENSQTNTAVSISQLALLATGKSILKLSETVAQTQGDAQLFLSLQSLSTIPAIHVTHGGVDTFKLTKDTVKLPVKTTAQRNAIASSDTGSVIYNSTTEDLNIKRTNDWAPVGSPVGSVQMFAGSVAPESWLLCNGSTLDSVANPKYAALFAVIGTTYGGTGAASFKLPDLQGRVPVGAGTGSGLTARTLAGTGGQQDLENHSHSAGSIVALQGRLGTVNIGTRGLYVSTAAYNSNQGYDYQGANPITQSMTNGIATQGESATVTQSLTDKNMQPYLVLNYIIKY